MRTTLSDARAALALARATRATLVTLAALVSQPLPGSLAAQERPAIVQAVDLLLPTPPTTVRIAGKTHVVYELHVTNFQSVDIALSRVQVLRADGSGGSIADYRDAGLSKKIGRPGLRRGQENPHVVGPGMRAIAYLWIELAQGADAPRSIRNRVEMNIMRPTGPVHAVVEGTASVVSREAPVALHPPLRGGPWTAIYDPLLVGGHRTVPYAIDGRARIPGRFAIDWIRLPSSGTIEKEAAPRPVDWNGYGAEVLAVADALVVAAMDDIPENPEGPAPTDKPMPLENASGNFVTLDLGRGRFAFYEHLKRGSVAVKSGDRVKVGQVIGRLGNSGSSSIGPHLHFHVADANSILGAEGLPFVFTRFEQQGSFSSIQALFAGEKWVANPEPHAKERRLERPGANAVVVFR